MKTTLENELEIESLGISLAELESGGEGECLTTERRAFSVLLSEHSDNPWILHGVRGETALAESPDWILAESAEWLRP